MSVGELAEGDGLPLQGQLRRLELLDSRPHPGEIGVIGKGLQGSGEGAHGLEEGHQPVSGLSLCRAVGIEPAHLFAEGLLAVAPRMDRSPVGMQGDFGQVKVKFAQRVAQRGNLASLPHFAATAGVGGDQQRTGQQRHDQGNEDIEAKIGADLHGRTRGGKSRRKRGGNRSNEKSANLQGASGRDFDPSTLRKKNSRADRPTAIHAALKCSLKRSSGRSKKPLFPRKGQHHERT